jgi:RNA polymerase sigma-70 factor (ECF subfamily)
MEAKLSPKRAGGGPSDPRVDELLEQIRSGDSRAFSKLVKELEPFVYGSSLKVCRDRDIAAENAQDTFVNMYRKLHQFDGTSKFSTWLYTIILNNCRMKRRRRKLGGAASEAAMVDTAELPASSAESPVEKLLGGELMKVLGDAIERLPDEYRAVFVLRDVEHLSNGETAAALGLSVAAAKSRLHRARELVRKFVERYVMEEK